MAVAHRPVRRDCGLVRIRGSARPFLASPTAHLPVSVLLHRIRDCTAWRIAALAAGPDRPRRGRRRLPPRTLPGRLATVAGVVRRGGYPLRLRRGADRPVDDRDRPGTGTAGAVSTRGDRVNFST